MIQVGSCCRLIGIPYSASGLSGPGVADADTHELRLSDTPLRLSGPIGGQHLLVALGGGGLQCLDLQLKNGSIPRLSQAQGMPSDSHCSSNSQHLLRQLQVVPSMPLPHEARGGAVNEEHHASPGINLLLWAGELERQVSSLHAGHYKCLAFNSRGTLVAMGAEDGSFQVLDWPALAIKFDNRSFLLRA